jgi:hypothetical protein
VADAVLHGDRDGLHRIAHAHAKHEHAQSGSTLPVSVSIVANPHAASTIIPVPTIG